jgi:hypothetical protein
VSDDENRPPVPVKRVNRRLKLAAIACVAACAAVGMWFGRWGVGLVAFLLFGNCWGQWFAGPDASDGRKALALWFPRATGDAARNVYYFEAGGFTDNPKYMRFDTHDTTIVRDFIARGGSGGPPLHADTTMIYGLTDGAPRWFQPPRDARQFRDTAGFNYLWVRTDGHRVWYFFADH